MIESLGIETIFREQANSLALAGSVEPDGIDSLSKRLYWAADNQTPLVVKLSLDASFLRLHLGHMVILRKLRAFQDLGHKAILMAGCAEDFLFHETGEEAKAEAAQHFKSETFIEQLGKVLDLRKGRIFYPEELLARLSLPTSASPVARMAALLNRAGEIPALKPLAAYNAESITLDDLESLSGNEMFEALFQGVASTLLEVDVELVTADHGLSFQIGREIQEATGVAFPQVGLYLPMLESVDGKSLMDKASPELQIFMADSAASMYEKLMQIPNEMVFRYEALLTPITPEQLEEQLQLMERSPAEGGLRAQDLKSHLAKWLVSQYYSPDESEQAQQEYQDAHPTQ